MNDERWLALRVSLPKMSRQGHVIPFAAKWGETIIRLSVGE